MALDPASLQRVQNHINRLWRGCPMCGHRQWQEVGFSMVQVSATGAPSWGATGVPTVAIACGQCGFVAQLARSVVGV